MSFMSRMLGILDESAPTRSGAAGRQQAEFHLGLLPEPDGRVLGEVQRQQMIAAIQAHREAYGVGLKEAKEAIELKRDQLRRG